MGDVFYKNKGLTAYARKVKAPEEIREAILEVLRDWKMEGWEDFLMRVMTYGEITGTVELGRTRELLDLMRGQAFAGPILPFTTAELDAMEITADAIKSDEWQQRFLRSVYYYINLERAGDAKRLFKLFYYFTDGLIMPDNVSVEAASVYNRGCLALYFYFLDVIPEYMHEAIFSGGNIIKGIIIGFNVEESLKQYLSGIAYLGNRKLTCRDLATFLLVNDAPLGQNSKGETMYFKDWLEKFRGFSQGKFGSMELADFIADKNYGSRLEEGEREALEELLKLYIRLSNGSLLLPESDMASVVVDAERITRKRKVMVAATSPNWSDILQNGFTTGSEVAVKEWISRQSAASAAREDILSAVKKSSAWNKEPQRSNLIQLDELFSARFPEPENALLYFDETVGSFMLNE